jgi:hypothetical protein
MCASAGTSAACWPMSAPAAMPVIASRFGLACLMRQARDEQECPVRLDRARAVQGFAFAA